MSVFKRKTSRGETAEYHYKFMQGGRWYHGVCENCTTERAALAFEKELRAKAKEVSAQKTVADLIEFRQAEITGNHPVTLASAYEAYDAKPRKRLTGAHQRQRNQTYWNDFCAFVAARFPDAVNLADVTRPMAEVYIAHLRTEGAFVKEVAFQRPGRRGKVKAGSYTTRTSALSPRTINARHKAIKAVFNHLAADAGLTVNPFDIPTLDNDTTSRDAFTDDELRRIGEAMTMPYIRPVFTIGLCTGLTLGDICLLRWREISGDWITDKRRRKTGVALEIPILPPLAAFLNEQRERTGGGEFVAPELAAMYQRNPSGVMYRIREFLEGLGIQTAARPEADRRAVSTRGAHALRHTFAYLAGVYSVPLPIVQSILGHMSPRMTELYQRHAKRAEKERFLRQMPDVLGVSTAAPVAVIAAQSEPERAELHRLADTLDIASIRKILQSIERA